MKNLSAFSEWTSYAYYLALVTSRQNVLKYEHFVLYYNLYYCKL